MTRSAHGYFGWTTRTVAPTRRFPIEIRYCRKRLGTWRMWSRHRSREAADRSWRELELLLGKSIDGYDIQMRNDIDGFGVLKMRYRKERP